MDKARVIEMAPWYYALAILEYVQASEIREAGFNEIAREYTELPNVFGPSLLSDQNILARAITLLRSKNLLEIIDDEFADTVFRTYHHTEEEIEELWGDGNSPFARYRIIKAKRTWVRNALISIAKYHRDLKIDDGDFDAAPSDEWSPLPLDREEPELKAVIDEIDRTLEQVRGDNGVLAATEVKTTLNKKETVDCLEKARTFKRLCAELTDKDRTAQNLETNDWNRYLERRPFFAFAYEDGRQLRTVQKNIEEWIRDNHVPIEDQIDAIFVLNRGIVVNLGEGTGVITINGKSADVLSGFKRKCTSAIFSQLISWLSLVCPRFAALDPILLKPRYAFFDVDGYTR